MSKETFGSNVIASKTIQVTNEKQIINWKGYGLRLHITPNSLPEGCSQFTLNMTVSSAKDCKLTVKDGILVSAVYSFHHDLGKRRLRQPVTLEMQHCVSSSSYSLLHIVQSDCKLLPCQFNHIVPRGRFSGSNNYGSIELDHFCCFSVMLQLLRDSLFPPLRFCAVLYYTDSDIKPRSFKFHILFPFTNIDQASFPIL